MHTSMSASRPKTLDIWLWQGGLDPFGICIWPHPLTYISSKIIQAAAASMLVCHHPYIPPGVSRIGNEAWGGLQPSRRRVTDLMDQLWNPSPTHNVDETRRDSHIDLERFALALALKGIISLCSLSLTTRVISRNRIALTHT